ncbi:hypothetical protein HanHA300_Chr14g0530031 [Helianthus annuus]|nr:hypothetical protein HanHA300_Chr14g0530031 [Helianthus annuus]KAJ0486277.1 hypothetical protein HanHA89_Chr14g0577901 [Helianthus annuus]KAJ0656829.1 hypothetical protein HanLR1_Chr14g0540321 [Helianthus annuus]KAJ0660427.1 hypothetical protein HanOQP8_Chr14g0537661 [Helianthus annuus]
MLLRSMVFLIFNSIHPMKEFGLRIGSDESPKIFFVCNRGI